MDLTAQARWDLSQGLQVGSEEERYLRVLQVAGLAPDYPWSVRGFLPGESERLVPTGRHPWEGAFTVPADAEASPSIGWARAESSLTANSAYPFGENDGALWAGRGINLAVRGGVVARVGPLYARFVPEILFSQNADFDLVPNGMSGEGRFRDPINPNAIDKPQRPSDGAFVRVGGGWSGIGAGLGPVAVGFTTASQHWGPSISYPLLLGRNAGGFPHAYVQSSRPLDIGIGRVHGKFIAGGLGQSDFSPITVEETRRFVSGAVLVLLPGGIDGLEIGAGRFVQGIWPEGGIGVRELLRPFGTGVSTGGLESNPSGENQIAGAFFRWRFSSAGIEVYSEVIREDFTRDLRHLFVEPDDLMARVFGIQRVRASSHERISVIRGEVVSAQAHHSERGDRFRKPGAVIDPLSRYQHGEARQGHTHRGQVLASPTAYGGSGFTLGYDRYDPAGRWSLELFYRLRMDWRNGQDALAQGGAADEPAADVQYGASYEKVLFREGWELAFGVAGIWNLDRNLVAGDDALNLNVSFGVRGLPW